MGVNFVQGLGVVTVIVTGLNTQFGDRLVKKGDSDTKTSNSSNTEPSSEMRGNLKEKVKNLLVKIRNLKLNKDPAIIIPVIHPIILVEILPVNQPVNIIKQIKPNLNSSGLFRLILNYFDIEIVEGNEEVVNYISSIAILSIISLLCLINIIVYLLIN